MDLKWEVSKCNNENTLSLYIPYVAQAEVYKNGLLKMNTRDLDGGSIGIKPFTYYRELVDEAEKLAKEHFGSDWKAL